jgi:hypothetical protein
MDYIKQLKNTEQKHIGRLEEWKAALEGAKKQGISHIG